MPLRAGWLHHRARFWAMSKDHLEDNVKAAAFLLPRLGPWLEDHMHVPTHTRKHSLSLSHSLALALALALSFLLSSQLREVSTLCRTECWSLWLH